MKRAAMALLGVAVVACSGERARPGPVGPEPVARLSVQITQPQNGLSVLAGFPVEVHVLARDLALEGLTGVGLVVRRVQPLELVDSQVVRFAARADSTHVFEFTVPATYSTNTQLDLRGLAFGTGPTSRTSEIRSVIVIRCAPNIPGCP